MIDFEMAAKKAYEELFVGIIVKGCLFHYGQSLFRKFVQIGFKTEYLENPILQVWFKSVALIPINTVETQFQNLKYQIKFEIFANEPTKIAKSEQFISYFERTYLGAARDSVQKAAIFPIIMWNHFDNDDDRTNNDVEGDNNKMKLFCGAAQPNISKAVKLLRQYETTAHDKYKNAQKQNARPPVRRPEVAKKETEFVQLRTLFRTKVVRFKDYFNLILNLYQFYPKKKYVELLLDTDVSDSEDDEDDDSGDETDEDDFDDEPFFNESIDEISNAVEKSLVVSETETNETLTETVAAAVVTFDPSTHAKCDYKDPNGVICGKICKKRGLNTHKSSHARNANK